MGAVPGRSTRPLDSNKDVRTQPSSTWRELVPFAMGVLAAAGLTISKFAEVSFLAEMSIAALVFLPIGIAAGFVSRAPSFVVGLVILGGIAVAVTVNALSDSVDRNLFPLEILW